jgi:A/G-specific adenine glycosylase
VKSNFFINWFKKHGRDFPWRREGVTPFQLLVTEMLLRKTTAASVSKIWEDFFRRYPNPDALASADEKKLMKQLKPLGFGNKKVSSLKLASSWLVERHHRTVPDNLDELLDIPSVGDYSARAVLCFAFNRRVEIVDNTVQRFFSRYYGLPIKADMRRNKWVWAAARKLLPRTRKAAKLHNYGLLDFVAQICKAGRPFCESCPLNESCAWGRELLRERNSSASERLNGRVLRTHSV